MNYLPYIITFNPYKNTDIVGAIILMSKRRKLKFRELKQAS